MKGETTPYKALLEAGQLRTKAGQLAMKADHIEMGVHLELNLDATAALTQTVMPGTMMAIAYGGEVDGMATRIPQDNLGKLELLVPMSVNGGELTLSRSVPYEPAAIISIGPHTVGALVVPRGTLRDFFSELRNDPGDGDLMQALARMIHLSVGYNTEMITGVAETFRKSSLAVSDTEIAEAPMFLQIRAGGQ